MSCFKPCCVKDYPTAKSFYLLFLILFAALVLSYKHAKSGSLKNEVRQELSVKMAPQELRLISDKRIAAKRHACAFHKMGDLKAKIEARGTSFPDVARYCLAVLREAGRRGTLAQFYGLLEPLGKIDPWERIFDAASQNKDSYVSASGKVHRIPCPLAFDAGYSAGFNQPDKSPPFGHMSIDRIEKITVACFEPGIEREILSIGQKEVTSAFLGYIAGHSKGQQGRNQKIPRGRQK